MYRAIVILAYKLAKAAKKYVIENNNLTHYDTLTEVLTEIAVFHIPEVI